MTLADAYTQYIATLPRLATPEADREHAFYAGLACMMGAFLHTRELSDAEAAAFIADLRRQLAEHREKYA